MSSWVKVVLNLFHLQSAVTVGIKFVESFIDKSLANRAKRSAEGRQKFVEANLAVTACVEYVEETLSIAGTHAWDSVVVEHGLELTEGQLTGAITIHDSELFLETDQALGASRRDPVLELVNDDLVLSLPGLTVTRLWEFLLSLS